ncbi:MAG: LacI family DNA-binding transcriptional regulator [Acidobacteria bacterium]|nr:LacI family DNA-binding transcriptional regulator [Acidobacteriota bacterium]
MTALKKKQITLKDIAERSGVAMMTVSRVVNGTGYVSEETHRRVMEVVDELNYRPNGAARSLKRQRTETVGLVLGDLSNPYSTVLANSVREHLAVRGYSLFICISEQSAQEDITAFNSLVDHNADGIIVATRSNTGGDKRLEAIADSGVPVVVVGRDFRHKTVDFVSADNLTGGFEATQHLIDLGHKRIAFLGGNYESRNSLKRLQGYLNALRLHGIEADKRLITGSRETSSRVPGYSTEKMGYEGMKRLLSLPDRPTAVFARNDFTAVGAMLAIKEAGLTIPQDIAIVGFDDTPLALHTMPALTTVRQPVGLQGQLAAEMLLNRISAKKVLDRVERVLDCELIVRSSTVVAV